MIAVFAGGVVGWLRPRTRTPRQVVPAVLRLPCASRLLKRCEAYVVPVPLLALLVANRSQPTISMLALGILILFWAARASDSDSRRPWSALDLPAVLLLGAACLGLIVSTNAELTFSRICALVVGLYLYDRIVSLENWNRLIDGVSVGLCLLGLGVAGIAIILMQPPHEKIPYLRDLFMAVPTIAPRVIHPNYVAGMLTLLLPASIGLSLSRSRRPLSLIHLPACAMTAALLLTQSRGALFGVIAALFGAFVVVFGSWRSLTAIGACIVLTCGSFLAGWWGLPSGLVTGAHEFSVRPELWDRALTIVQDFPITGIGLGAFPEAIKLLYPLFSAGPDTDVPHAHNLFLQVAVELGLLGFVAFWIMLGAAARMWWQGFRVARASGNQSHLCLLFGLLSSGVAHLCYSITDTVGVGEKAGLICWALLGALTAMVRLLSQGEAGESPRHVGTPETQAKR